MFPAVAGAVCLVQFKHCSASWCGFYN